MVISSAKDLGSIEMPIDIINCSGLTKRVYGRFVLRNLDEEDNLYYNKELETIFYVWDEDNIEKTCFLKRSKGKSGLDLIDFVDKFVSGNYYLKEIMKGNYSIGNL